MLTSLREYGKCFHVLQKETHPKGTTLKKRTSIYASFYLVFIQNIITGNKFLNVLTFSPDANYAIVSTYRSDLYINNKHYDFLPQIKFHKI